MPLILAPWRTSQREPEHVLHSFLCPTPQHIIHCGPKHQVSWLYCLEVNQQSRTFLEVLIEPEHGLAFKCLVAHYEALSTKLLTPVFFYSKKQKQKQKQTISFPLFLLATLFSDSFILGISACACCHRSWCKVRHFFYFCFFVSRCLKTHPQPAICSLLTFLCTHPLDR